MDIFLIVTNCPQKLQFYPYQICNNCYLAIILIRFTI